jgi:hypothetical protein
MSAKSAQDPELAERPPVTMKLTEQYMGLLVIVLTRAGLIKVFSIEPLKKAITYRLSHY